IPPEVSEAERALRGAARDNARARVESYRNHQLPAILTDSHRLDSVPAVLAAALNGQPPDVRRDPAHSGRVQVAGLRVPEITHGVVLVDFEKTRRGDEFRRLTYSGVLRDGRVFLRKRGGGGPGHRPAT